MEVMYPRCAGLDVHKETVVACVRIVAGGEVSRSVRTFATTTANLIELGEWLEVNGCTHVAMDATGVYWKPVWQVLADGAFELILANAAQVKSVPGRKTDVNDATWLSELLAHGLVRASFVPEPAIQELRGLLRTRKQLVREKASHVQRLQKTLEEANIKIESVLSDVMGRSGRAMIQALIRLTRSLRGPKFLSTSYSLGQVGTDWQFVGLGGFFVAAGAHGGYECPQSLIRTSKVFSTLCGWRHIFKTSRDAISKRSGFHPIY